MGKSSGKSKSYENQNGIRRKNPGGIPLAPRSLRQKYRLIKNCPLEVLDKIGITE